ncbi:hypothetical protein AAES_119458 [Amazona aestiva]|uniref:Uncharacterized protein n=1 Tax=Amazona aestiva TaxID=12930 RepID=A0A0Q3M6J9_AMAAE|nr:hypothetical protein AAES_119458 [Amazona aestiva]
MAAEMQRSSCSADYKSSVLVRKSFNGLKSDGKGLQNIFPFKIPFFHNPDLQLQTGTSPLESKYTFLIHQLGLMTGGTKHAECELHFLICNDLCIKRVPV